MTNKPSISPTSEWLTAIQKHIAKLKDNDRYEFAHKALFEIAIQSGCNAYEMIGLLEIVKHDLMATLQSLECDGDCDNCDDNMGDCTPGRG